MECYPRVVVGNGDIVVAVAAEEELPAVVHQKDFQLLELDEDNVRRDEK